MPPKSPPDITVHDIANWFLAKAQSENKSLKHMKLQKLVYFAYGWYFAYFDRPLFEEEIYAWRHGPVVEELYHRYKRYGKNPIDISVVEFPIFEENTTEILEDVWQNYSSFSDVELSVATHRPNSPWRKAYSSYEWDAKMPPETIREYFKGLREEYKNVRT